MAGSTSRDARSVWGALALSSLLLAVAADAQTLAHLPAKPGMKACYLEVPIGNEITSLLCLNDGVAQLSSWEKQKAEERKWHETASLGAFGLAQQAYRNGHPQAPELFYGVALLSIHGVPHAIPNSEKKQLCEAANQALSAGCRVERCRSGAGGGESGESAQRSSKFAEVLRWHRTACVKKPPEICMWDEKKPAACSGAVEPISREWAAYSSYARSLSRIQESERLLPLLAPWRSALEAYEQSVYPKIDSGQTNIPETAQLLPPILVAGLAARKAFDVALWDAQSRANASFGEVTQRTLSPWMKSWRDTLQKAPEASGFEALHRYDSQVGAIRTAISDLAR